MAELFLAKNEREELVVIKRILPYLAQEKEFVQMFLDEARIAAQLHHPNIIQVSELGKLQDSIFIAMEYVEGVDVKKILSEEQKKGRAIPYGLAALITERISEGLAYAHGATSMDGRPMEVIHRDVSPANVMVSFDGEVKLVDFGIAKAGALMERSKPGVIKGKFLYLSPEQLSQERLDQRADLFALGTMLYEITVGKSPFYKSSTEAVIYAIRHEEPPPPHLARADYPPALQKIVMRCLAKDRNKRYQTAEEVRHDLSAFLATQQADARALADYVAQLFRTEEDATIMHVPQLQLPAPVETPKRTAASARKLDPVPQLEPEPATKSERVSREPEEPQTTPPSAPPAVTSPPIRHTSSSPRYPAAGEAENTLTTQRTNPAKSGGQKTDPVPAPSVAQSPAAASLSAAQSLRTESGTTTQSVRTENVLPRPGKITAPSAPMFEPPPLPSGPVRRVTDEISLTPQVSQPLAFAGEMDTANMRSGKVPRDTTPRTESGVTLPPRTESGVTIPEQTEDRPAPPRHVVEESAPADLDVIEQGRNPLVIGIVAFLAVLLSGLLFLALFRSPPREEPATDTASAPVAPPTATAPGEPRHDGVVRVPLTFVAPRGTAIVMDGEARVPGQSLLLLPGAHKFQYQCPGRHVLVNGSLDVEPTPDGKAMRVELQCQVH